jgi:hypothetical protein
MSSRPVTFVVSVPEILLALSALNPVERLDLGLAEGFGNSVAVQRLLSAAPELLTDLLGLAAELDPGVLGQQHQPARKVARAAVVVGACQHVRG